MNDNNDYPQTQPDSPQTQPDSPQTTPDSPRTKLVRIPVNDNEKALLDCARELAKLQGKKAPSTKAMFATVLELYIASGKTPQKQKKHGANTVVIDSPKLSDDIREFCRLKECTQYELGSAVARTCADIIIAALYEGTSPSLDFIKERFSRL